MSGHVGGGGRGCGVMIQRGNSQKVLSHFQYFIYCLFGIIELRGSLNGVLTLFKREVTADSIKKYPSKLMILPFIVYWRTICFQDVKSYASRLDTSTKRLSVLKMSGQ
jgi:hypothetical protein